MYFQMSVHQRGIPRPVRAVPHREQFLVCLLKSETVAQCSACQTCLAISLRGKRAHYRSFMSLEDFLFYFKKVASCQKPHHVVSLSGYLAKLFTPEKNIFQRSISLVITGYTKYAGRFCTLFSVTSATRCCPPPRYIDLVAASGINSPSCRCRKVRITVWPQLRAHQRRHVGCSWWPSSSCLGGCHLVNLHLLYYT